MTAPMPMPMPMSELVPPGRVLRRVDCGFIVFKWVPNRHGNVLVPMFWTGSGSDGWTPGDHDKLPEDAAVFVTSEEAKEAIAAAQAVQTSMF